MAATSKSRLPGDALGSVGSYMLGSGTHLYRNQIRSSVAGSPVVHISQSTAKSTPERKNVEEKKQQQQHPVISVARSSMSTTNVLPTVSTPVYCLITRLGHSYATCSILVVGSTPLTDSFPGIIRREDVRITEKDKIVLSESFRVGDIVKAQVISLGDQSNYYLSTAGNEYGVVMAKSLEGNPMYPVSWKEMRDAKTGRKEIRKVAKII